MATLMFDRHTNETDLTRLNEAERQVLLMLAEGHTAKSVANALGSTAAAVNERLRDARRKTGIGSSRELARLLKSQENCPEEIGVAKAGPDVMLPEIASGTHAGSRWKVSLLMIGLLFTTAVAAAFALQPAPWSTAPSFEEPFSDPLVGNILAPADPEKVALIPTTVRDYRDPLAPEKAEIALRRLHAQVRARPSDELKAKELAAAYKAFHPIKLSTAPLRVICSDKLCEVATTTQVPTPQAEIDATLGEVQGADLRQRAARMGLKPAYMFFGLHPAGDRAAYLGYWARAR